MRFMTRPFAPIFAIVLFATAFVSAQPTTAPSTHPVNPKGPIDLSSQKTLYVVGYAHLDTQWRWTYPLVIREYIANTLHRNFDLIEKYPNYVFNFSGSRRYEMMKEYFPQEYEKLKKYIADGRWFPCGSSVDENDANVPSSESQIRHVLYGNHYFKREFGVESREFMLPDCFGFPASLPSILAHCGIKGFSTQKLTWGSANGIPFKVGVWEGVDGESVIAALDPGGYGSGIVEDLSKNDSWRTRIENTGKISGVFADYHYYGTGDRGGSPDARSVEWLEKSVCGEGPLMVLAATAEKMFLDITAAQRAKLPKYKGELLLTEHSAGSITSEGYMKRWNRKNELLADAAERASVAAAWLGGASYPMKKLYDAWDLVLGSQMHDMLPGTSLPKAYEYCWNDEILALNQFAAAAQDGVGVVASQMNTQAQQGAVSLLIYNPLSIDRDDVVEATVALPPETKAVQVVGPDGKQVAAQVVGRERDGVKIAFAAHAPSVGFVMYAVRAASDNAAAPAGELKADGKAIENARFRVTVNDAGDIASIFDKQNNKEVLAEPSRFAFLYENPAQFPAWNMDWNDRKNPPRSYVTSPAQVRVVESGPVRVTLEVSRESEGSRFVQRISLASGAAGDRVDVANTIDWQTQQRSLKATFPLTVANPQATYQISLGALQRGNNDPKKYEVPQHEWFDLTSPDGKYGVAVLNDCKYGSDKPTDNTLRLTMVYTPGVRGGYRDQSTQDIGRHNILYSIAPHAGDWKQGKVQWIARRVNQPMLAFATPSHPGPLGREFSLLKLNTDQVAVDAIKKAEDSDEVVVRLKELSGEAANDVRITAASPIASAREVDGQERELGNANLQNGAIVTEVKPFHLKAFAMKIGDPAAKGQPAQSQAVNLSYDIDAVSSDANRSDGAFDADGRTLAAEQLPAKIQSEGIEFAMGPTADGQKNALTCRGQTIQLPAGFARVYLLAAAIEGDQQATFKIGNQSVTENVQNWGGYIGQWDNRLWDQETPESATEVAGEVSGLVPGFVKRDTVAWYSSHRHHPTKGNEHYQYSYLFKYGMDVPAGATSLTLPDNPKVRVFAITVAKNSHDQAVAASPLYDTFDDRSVGPQVASIMPQGGSFNDITPVTLNHSLYWKSAGLHYTLDGSEPTTKSPVYDNKPILLSSSATVRVRQFDPSGKAGPEASAQFNVNDTTAPTVKSVSAIALLPTIQLNFSEPLRKADAEKAESYRLEPAVKVKSAKLSEDGTSVTVALAEPLRVPEAGQSYRLTINGVRDLSPAGNPVASAEPIAIALSRPVYTLDAITCSGSESKEQPVASLPAKGKDAWSINLFVKVDQQPENRTIIAGFGRAQDSNDGLGRYLCKFGQGIHFWSRGRDVSGRGNPLDLGTWQMLSATYDGQTLRLYKNGRRITQRTVSLEDDESVVRIAPIDPWDQQRRFKGEIRNFTIWNTALPPEALKVLQESAPQQQQQAATPTASSSGASQ